MGKIPKLKSLALVGGASTTYSSGRKLFAAEPVNGFASADDKSAGRETEGLLAFSECFVDGNPVGKDNLLYWSSLHREIGDSVQSDFGRALHERFGHAMTVAQAGEAMRETLIACGAGTPQSHVWLTLDVSRIEGVVGANPDGTPKTIHKKMVKVVKAEYCTPTLTAPTAPTTTELSQNQ